jgi:hypothetical protein
MKEDLIADLWSVVIEHIPEKYRKDVAADYVNTLLDHGIKTSILEGLQGIDPYLDDALDYVMDGDDAAEDDEDYYEDED